MQCMQHTLQASLLSGSLVQSSAVRTATSVGPLRTLGTVSLNHAVQTKTSISNEHTAHRTLPLASTPESRCCATPLIALGLPYSPGASRGCMQGMPRAHSGLAHSGLAHSGLAHSGLAHSGLQHTINRSLSLSQMAVPWLGSPHWVLLITW